MVITRESAGGPGTGKPRLCRQEGGSAAQRVETGRPERWAALGKSLTISEPWFPQPPNLEMGFCDPQGPLWFSKSMIIIVNGTPQFGVEKKLRSQGRFCLPDLATMWGSRQ